MNRRCVIPSCSLFCDSSRPYCSKYHEIYDKDRLYAASKGFFLSEGCWGPPWPIYLQPTLEEEQQQQKEQKGLTNLYERINKRSYSPEIGINSEQNQCLTPDFSSQSSITSSSSNRGGGNRERYSTPTVEEEVEEGEGLWHSKGDSQQKKRKNYDINLLTPNFRKIEEEIEEIKEIEKETTIESKKQIIEKISPLKRKKRSQPILTLNYKISEDSKPITQRQLNISQYFRKKTIL